MDVIMLVKFLFMRKTGFTEYMCGLVEQGNYTTYRVHVWVGGAGQLYNLQCTCVVWWSKATIQLKVYMCEFVEQGNYTTYRVHMWGMGEQGNYTTYKSFRYGQSYVHDSF